MSIFSFTEFESFYREYNPLTPYGKNDRAKKELFFSENFLKNEYTLIGSFISLVLTNSAKTSAIEYHLKRIPNINFLENLNYSVSDIFQVKKFLYNYKNISEKLPKEIFDLFFVKFQITELYRLLNLNDDKETFYISEKYSEKLMDIRNKIKTFDSKLAEMKRNRLEEIKQKFNLDFRFQSFIVINESKVLNIDDKFVYKESYDSSNVLLKPVFQHEYFTLHSEKENLVKEEKKEEKNILINLTAEIKNELKLINNYINSIHKFDVILAKALLAYKYKMKPPVLCSFDSNIEIVNGRCIPVEKHCIELETKYFPLNVNFSDRLIVISGSNMGGKTVVLKTLGFLQLLTQMGFYVPADAYKTTVFENLHYIGDLQHKHSAGLSSYGMEIFEFINSSSNKEERSLYLIDEFAGTTNSFEAEALISSILYDFSSRRKAYAFLSTHFMNLPEHKNMSFYKMKGLDSEKYEKYYKTKSDYDFTERIKLINSFMRYEIEHDVNRDKSYDALKIAAILGLDQNIIKDAKSFLKK